MDCKVKLNFFESKLRAKINQYQREHLNKFVIGKG